MLTLDELPPSVDLLVVGSGPVGSAIAATARRLEPRARILMVDAGSAASPNVGEHAANLVDRRADAPRGVFDTTQHALAESGPAARPHPRPGTEFTFAGDSDLPAYAQATTVGGLGVRWTGAAPRPDVSEQDPSLLAVGWEAALDQAEQLLHVQSEPWPDAPLTRTLLARLAAEYTELPPSRPVAQMPTALTWDQGRPRWTGPRTILGGLLTEPATSFALLPATLCSELVVAQRRVTRARLTSVGRSAERVIATGAVAVAADAVRTPQLLWASGIRPAALGRHIGDHLQLLASVSIPDRMSASWDDDRTAAMLWIPYTSNHEFHGQVMLFDQEPPARTIGGPSAGCAGGSVVGFSWLLAPTLTRQNRLLFSSSARDAAGMPRPIVDYPLLREDRHRIQLGMSDQRRAMRALGDMVLPGGMPRLLPRGSSLHLFGTVRAGGKDDGSSVCDTDGRVWGLDNLFVGGNGVISGPTACNPTLTSVALGVRAGTAAVRG